MNPLLAVTTTTSRVGMPAAYPAVLGFEPGLG